MNHSTAAITVENLVKRYPDVTAVAGISFSVRPGEIFGLLGPNGAGKTTTLQIIEGIRQADAGRVTVLGHDPQRDGDRVKQRIGVQLQHTSLLPEMTALEQVLLFARLYRRRLNEVNGRRLLAQVGLQEKADALPGELSGGQQQRLALALALVNDPEIVFLDEPTAGLDPQARRGVWRQVRRLRDNGRTVVLTTHYLEEAEALCERVGIIDRGKLLALDTPGALINAMDGATTLTISATLPTDVVGNLPGVGQVWPDGDLLRLQSSDVATTTGALLALAAERGAVLHDLHIRQPSLEDVFLRLTGRNLQAGPVSL